MDMNIKRIGYQGRIGNVLKTKRVKKQEREDPDKEKNGFADQLDIAQLKQVEDDEDKEKQAKEQKRLTAANSGKEQKALPPKEEDDDQEDDLGVNIDIKV